MRPIEQTKPYTLPETCTHEALIRCYWHVVSSDPRWLTNLQRPDGSLYLERQGDSAERKSLLTSTIVISYSEAETRAS